MDQYIMMFLVHMTTYWLVGGLFTLGDIIIYNNLPFSEFIKQYKIGKVDNRYIEYTKIAGISSIKNQFFITLPLIYIFSKYIISNSNIFFLNECLKILFYILTGDIWFYTTHRMLHEIPFLYKLHKHHHRLALTCALAALDSNIIEHILVVGSFIIGPYLYKGHILTLYFWIILATFNVVNSHCGYFKYNNKHSRHNIHHKLLKYNYGNGFYLMDKAFGTEIKYL